jgi:hypothetical protein
VNIDRDCVFNIEIISLAGCPHNLPHNLPLLPPFSSDPIGMGDRHLSVRPFLQKSCKQSDSDYPSTKETSWCYHFLRGRFLHSYFFPTAGIINNENLLTFGINSLFEFLDTKLE